MSSESTEDAAVGERHSRRSVVLVAMTISGAMVLVDQTAVPLILPSIMRDMHIGSQLAQWVMNASLLPLAGLLVLGGRLADLLGRRRVFIAGSALFALASVGAGLSPVFGSLVAFRALQGIGGALMLPTSVAIVSAAYPATDRGRALGIMGGAAAIAGALGPAIGGTLASTLGWRSVLLINLPLGIVAVACALLAVPRDEPRTTRAKVDLPGAALFAVALIGLVFGLSQSQVWGWASFGVWLPLAVSVAAGVLFVLWERRSADPILDFGLLRRHPNYLAATASQGLAGMAEMGLGVLFPLLLVLNLGMTPALAGLALIPATLPMIAVAPLAGRWYDRLGGRSPLIVGFVIMAISGVLLAVGVHSRDYWLLFPGFIVYGIGLAIVLTVNDPVTLDTIPETEQGQASGVSATAEQFGGAFGIAVLYLVYHSVYLSSLLRLVDDNRALTDLSPSESARLKETLIAAESTGLNPHEVSPDLFPYLRSTFQASAWGMSAAFLLVTALSLLALVVVIRLVRKPLESESPAE